MVGRFWSNCSSSPGRSQWQCQLYFTRSSEWTYSNNGRSSTTQNCGTSMVSFFIRSTINVICLFDQIKNTVYALMADETKDISGNEQMSIVIRFTDRHTTTTSSSYNLLHERFLGFVRLHQFDAQSLAQELIHFLRQYQIKPLDCICQCYDG